MSNSPLDVNTRFAETLMRAIRDRFIDRTCLKVLGHIIETTNPLLGASVVDPGAIAHRCGMSIETASNNLSILRARGYIATKPHMYNPTGDRRFVTHYHMLTTLLGRVAAEGTQ